MIESWLKTFLLDQSGVTAIVGDRIEVDNLPEGIQFPCLRFETASGVPVRVMGGRQFAGIMTYRIQFDCFAKTKTEANAIIDALFQCLQGKRDSSHGLTLRNAWMDEAGPHGTADDPFDGSDDWLYQRTVDYFFKVEEPKPTA